MSAPPKPWERVGINNQNSSPNLSNQLAGNVPPFCQPGGGGPLDPLSQPGASQAPPPVPVRPSQQTTSPFNSYGGGYSSYGGLGSYGGFGTGSMYSPYGSGLYGSSMYGNSMYGGMGMNRFGQDPNNSYVRMAEENSRQAFQSIEGIVQAFGSVAMMLESTYSAVYNSFRAVIGVADHFSRMKTHFAQIFSAFAILRTLKWLLSKILVLLRLREALPNDEMWMEAAAAGFDASDKLPGSKKPSTSWPLLLFFAVILGGPWLIWRFLSSLRPETGKGWATGEDDHFVALAEYDFDGETEDELNLKKGQRIFIAPKELQPQMRGWLLGAVDGKTGILPAAYVKILGKRRGTKFTPSNPQPPQQYTGPAPLPSTSGTTSCKSSVEAGPTGQQQPSGLPAIPSSSGSSSCCKGPAKTDRACQQQISGTSRENAVFESALNEIDTNATLDLESGKSSARRNYQPHQNVNNTEAVDILDNPDMS